jgi:hypothetical protein
MTADIDVVIPHRWWCSECFTWRACGCFTGHDHTIPYWLDPLTIDRYLGQETRLLARAAHPPVYVRSLRAYRRALARDALELTLAIQALAHARRCPPNGRQTLGEVQPRVSTRVSGS